MIKRLVILLAALIFSALFSACADGVTPSPSPTGAGQEAAGTFTVTGERQEFPEVSPFGEPAVLDGRINENGWLKILTPYGPVIPYEYDPVGEILNGDGSVKQEGLPLSAFLPQIIDELPVADRAQGFDLDIYEWGTAYLIDVFGSDFDMLAHMIDTRELTQLAREHDEELIVDIHIVVTGCEADEWPEERFGKGYAFILSAVDPNAGASAASENEPFLRLYCSGEEVETREFFMYGASAHYDENGVAKGMLHADGKAFFDPDHIAGAYDDLPVYSGSRTEGLDIRLCDGAEIVRIFVYDPAKGFERTELFSKAELDGLIIASAEKGTEYVVEVIVRCDGDYIEELGECESTANGYAFIVR